MDYKIETAFIFAAGFGKRMLPLTLHTPKPLLPFKNKPIIEYTIDKLIQFGIKHIIVNSHHLADKIREYFYNNSFPCLLTITYEIEILETGGGVVNAIHHIGDKPFFAINGDIVWDDVEEKSILDELTNQFDDKKYDGILALVSKENSYGYEGNGDFSLNQEGTIYKTSQANEYIFTGIQILKPELFQDKKKEPFSLREIYFGKKTTDGIIPNFQNSVLDGKWYHLGTPESLAI